MSDLASLHAAQRAFAQALRDHQAAPPPASNPTRFAIYRELIPNNLYSLLSGAFPVLLRLFGETKFRALIDAWLLHERAETALFTELADEFLLFLCTPPPAVQADPNLKLPTFTAELAHYERAEAVLWLAAGEDCIPPESTLLDSDRWQRRSATQLLAYRHPVHAIGPDFQPDPPTEDAPPTLLLLYRRREQVAFMQLDALAYHTLNALAAPHTLAALVARLRTAWPGSETELSERLRGLLANAWSIGLLKQI
jgi:uncharacterized protein